MDWFRHKSWLVLVGFLLVGFLVYAPSLGGPFQFDDKRVVLDPKVRELRSVWGFVHESVNLAAGGQGLGLRALVSASFLAQWQASGEDTRPYHVFNLGLHVLASFLVFILVAQILNFLKQETRSKKQETRIFWLAVFGGAVFLLHPMQSQAVAYISQRYVSMMGMFYLACVVLYLEARKRRVKNKERGSVLEFWLYGASWLMALVAMSSKEVAVTLPVMLVVLEVVVVRQRLKLKNYLILGLFFVLMAKIPLQVIMAGKTEGVARSAKVVVGTFAAVEEPHKQGLTRSNYALTQISVVATYLRMMLLPYGQAIDHDYQLVSSIWHKCTMISLWLLFGLAGLAWWRFRKGEKLPILAFLWWFIPLSVTSSIIPIRDYIYEHRVYLSSVGFVLLLIYLIQKFYLRYVKKYGKTSAESLRLNSYLVIVCMSLLILYSGLTMLRANVWADEVRLWEDSWKKNPNKARTNKNYGFVLIDSGEVERGIERVKRAIEIEPGNQDYYIVLGAAYLRLKQWEEALKQFEKAVELKPDRADGWNNMGVALFQLERYEESREAFLKSIEADDEFFMAWLGLGGAEMYLGNIEASERALRKSLEFEPKDFRAWGNLVLLYMRNSMFKKAWEVVGEWEAVDPFSQEVQQRKQAVLEKL